jgi:hypothetical protein
MTSRFHLEMITFVESLTGLDEHILSVKPAGM